MSGEWVTVGMETERHLPLAADRPLFAYDDPAALVEVQWRLQAA
jgi:hypothetical protein